jgi:hypothetical protein
MLTAIARHSGQAKFWMGHIPPVVAAIVEADVVSLAIYNI